MREFSLPLGWEKRRLADLAHYCNGRAFKPEDWSVDGVRIIRIEQLNNPEGRYDHFQGWFPDANAVDDGDLIFSWSATLKVAIWRHGKGVLNQHLFKVVPKPGFDKRFIFYILDFSMEALGGGSHGSTMKHIKRGELERYSVAVPSLSGQQRIAEILSTVDEAIEQTEALITKTQQIRAGLMHDLFARGISPDGKLRPPREEGPQFYKESPLGWIPKEWEVDAFGNRVTVIDPNPSHRYPDEQETGVPICSTENFRGDDEFDLSESKLMPPDVLIQQQLRCHFSRDDVVFARKGRIGLARRYGDEPKVFSHTVVLFKTTMDLVDQAWLLWLSRSHWFLDDIDQRMNANSGVPTLGVAFINAVIVPFPPKDEQQLISRHLDDVSARAAADQAELQKLRHLKAGMMQDLLTGGVPVAVRVSAEAPEVA